MIENGLLLGSQAGICYRSTFSALPCWAQKFVHVITQVQAPWSSEQVECSSGTSLHKHSNQQHLLC